MYLIATIFCDCDVFMVNSEKRAEKHTLCVNARECETVQKISSNSATMLLVRLVRGEKKEVG